VFHWRRLYREGKFAAEPAQAMQLLPVSIAEHELVERPAEEVVIPSCGSIHIELGGEVRISVEGGADPAAIRAVLERSAPVAVPVPLFTSPRDSLVNLGRAAAQAQDTAKTELRGLGSLMWSR